jgi:signal transduction histidine kinase
VNEAVAVATMRGGAFERLLTRVRVPEHVARLLTATATFRWSWIGAAVAAVVVSVGAAHTAPRTTLAFLVVIPLLPIGGVALAYGPWADPMDDLSRAAPVSSARLLLLRATAVLATTAVGMGLAALLLPGVDLPMFAWMLPSLGLTLATLALSTVVATHLAAAAITVAWVVAAAVAELRSDVTNAALSGPGQIAFFVLAVGSAGVLAWRHERLDREGRQERQRLIDAAEHERRRIERNLHDGAQQQLVAISVKLGLATGLVTRDPDRAVALLESLRTETHEALELLRETTRGSCPPVLADDGLEAALAQKVSGAATRVEVHAEGLGRFPLPVEVAVYYCVCEAMQNAAKHARAEVVVVSVRKTAGELLFTVTDDGSGFDQATTRRGIGLRSLEERVEALGGSLAVRSAPGAGTTVAGRVPVPPR